MVSLGSVGVLILFCIGKFLGFADVGARRPAAMYVYIVVRCARIHYGMRDAFNINDVTDLIGTRALP